MSTADLTAFMLIFNQVQDILNCLNGHWDFLEREFPDIERFLELLQTKPTLKSGSKKMDLCGSIEFSDVSFEYPQRPGIKALDKLSLAIEPNKVTAIVGESGAGKSTVTNLLMRL